ncbi:sister chromatid cohesion protein PDS5 homolog D-like isoform X2 [Solanum dulcamara]|uniref:sister chromatid cohesion protein PDS5 homolog D-like isoform X2 n=1 Tax=Solanum dulcamara TaxID=45834 RepID=UPI002485750C|nr:sister chromatid cohesion protein PDS5 homolog D-like isoform X2 [Solanum dulcamara]
MTDSSSQKEIEDGLKDCGISLSNLPPSTEELISLLDKVEYLLIKVDQAPTDSMKDALLPVMKAVVRSELLKHTDADVKVSVVSCLNEISRISAPQQPYDDELMKEIFQLTVRVFEELSHSGRRYHKAVNILETVAEVKACMMLLDLECDALVIEIFQMFLRIIRLDHPNVVFTSMEVIMTLLIEESDEINMELLQPLLDSLRKKNQIWSPISSKLGEKVLKECASTVRPCILEALKSRSMNLDDYAEIVASICNKKPEGEQMTENENVTDAVYPEKVGPSAAVICETLLEDGPPSNNNGTSSKTLQHCSQMEQLKNTGVSSGSHGCRYRAKKKDSRENKDVLQSHDNRNECKVTSCSKRKPRQSSRKRGSDSKGDVDTTSGLNIVKREGNLTDAEESSVQQIDEKKQKKEIQDIEESGDEEIKLSFGDENLSSQLAKTKRRRKVTMRKDQDSKRRRFTKNHGDEIVGSRIRVWWPLDETFYEGAISTFDPVKKMHEIAYDDGETETLNLNEEVFEILEDNPSDKKHEADLQCNAVSSVPSMKKKAKRTSIKKEPRVSSSKRSKKNPQKCDIGSMDIPIPDKMSAAADVGCETSSGKKDLVDKEDKDMTPKQRSKTCKVALQSSLTPEDHPSDKKHETDLQSNDVSAVLSIKKKGKRTSTIKREPGVSSCKRSKKNPQKSDIGSMDIPIPDIMNDTDDVGCETSGEKKELVHKEDNDITQKQRSKTSKVALERSLTLEVHPSDKKHEENLQSNDASSVPCMKKKAKRAPSTKKEPGVSSSKRSKRKPQKSGVESLDIPIPDKMNDAAGVGCETSSGIKELVDKEDNDIIQKQRSKTCKVALGSSLTLEVHPSDKKHETDLQSNDVSSSLSTKKKATRTSSVKKEHRVSSSKRSKRKAEKSDNESLDIPIPDKMTDASDVGCEMSSSSKRSKRKAEKSDNESLDIPIPDKMTDASDVGCEMSSSSKRSKRKAEKSDNESLDIPIPDKMTDASDVGCEMSSGKKQLVDNEDEMITEAESKTLEVALESSLTPVHSQHCQNNGS